jgi:hypothetical protein
MFLIANFVSSIYFLENKVENKQSRKPTTQYLDFIFLISVLGIQGKRINKTIL